MWNDRLRFPVEVEQDWALLSPGERELAKVALETIDQDPIAGAPLFEPLRGVWIYRLEQLRILYRLAPEARTVLVLAIDRISEADR